MASFLSSSLPLGNHIPHFNVRRIKLYRVRAGAMGVKASLEDADDHSQKSTRLVTFLGKGGSGKTTSAVFAAQMVSERATLGKTLLDWIVRHYANSGLSTCLVIHSQDSTAEHLLDCKIGNSPVVCSKNLSAVRLETTEMILEPLNRLKQADSRINMTQGILEGIVGEELGVLPGMDSTFTALALGRFLGFFKITPQRNDQTDRFDIIVYDGLSTEEILRMIGAASKARLYLKYLRNVAEKTDFGRLAGPSILRLADEAMGISGINGKMSSEIWDALERMLEKGSSTFLDPNKFRCFIVMDSTNPISVSCALRYWGCTLQAGAQVSGAFAFSSSSTEAEYNAKLEDKFSPLPFAPIPYISFSSSQDWNSILTSRVSKDARDVISLPESHFSGLISPVKFNPQKKCITLLMPGFDKSEIKLFQFRGGSELLVEAGDQRRVIMLPKQIQGKVGAAKFIDRNLVITMR